MGLKVWLPLNNNFDNLGCSNVSTVVSGTTTFADGKIGKGLSCNGSSFWTVSSVTLGAEASICCWSKTSTSGKMMWVLTSDASAVLNLYCSGIYTLNIGDGNNNPFKNGSNNISVLTDGLWHHFVVTFGNNTAKLYIDGAHAGTTNTFRNPTTTNKTIKIGGGYSGGHSYDWNGMINDFRVYDHCLSAAEVKEISQGLVLHYKLDTLYNNNLFKYNGLNNYNQELQLNNYNNTGSFTQFANCLTINPADYLNKKFTISFDAISPNGTTALHLYNTNGNPRYFYYSIKLTSDLSNQWQHFSYTFTNTDRGSNYSAGSHPLEIYMPSQMGGKVRNIKVEFGETETAWSNPNLIFDNLLIQDSSGYNHNGTINDPNIQLITTTSRYAACIKNSQANNSATYPIKGECNIPDSTALTFSWWMNPTSWGSQTSGIFSTSNGSATDYNTTAANMRDSCFDCCNTSGTCVRINVASHLTLNEWHHYALTYNGSQLIFYKDGVSKVTANQTGALKAFQYIYPFYSKAGGVNRCTSGSLSDFRIYVTALSAADVKQLYEVGGKIDNKANLHTYELNEFGSNKLTKTGILKDYIVEPFLILPDGSKWQLMLYHYVDGGRNLFTSSNATYCNDFGLYSRLRDIDNFKYDSTKYEFYVLQDDIEYRWTQTNAPTAASPSGFTAINGYINPVQGLVKPTNLTQTYFGYNAWWGACGCWTSYSTGGRTGIPGFGSHDANGICTRYLALYARVTDFNAKVANLSASASNFIEL